jgi:hypothetical protein
MDADKKDDKDVFLVIIDYSIGVSTTISIHQGSELMIPQRKIADELLNRGIFYSPKEADS